MLRKGRMPRVTGCHPVPGGAGRDAPRAVGRVPSTFGSYPRIRRHVASPASARGVVSRGGTAHDSSTRHLRFLARAPRKQSRYFRKPRETSQSARLEFPQRRERTAFQTQLAGVVVLVQTRGEAAVGDARPEPYRRSRWRRRSVTRATRRACARYPASSRRRPTS